MAAKKDDKSATTEEEPQAGGKKKKLIIIIVAVVVLLAGGGGAYFLFFTGDSEPPPPEPAAVLVLEPININLAGGHYLKIGLALQETTKAGKEIDGSKALDITISLLSNREVSELSSARGRQKIKTELTKQICEAYEGEVMDVYLTQFVMQ